MLPVCTLMCFLSFFHVPTATKGDILEGTYGACGRQIIFAEIQKLTRNLKSWQMCFREKYYPEVIWSMITCLGDFSVTGFVNESKE